MRNHYCKIFLALFIAGVIWISLPTPNEAASAKDLAGLWQAKNRFGPDVRGTLLIQKVADKWFAEISGQTVEAKVDGKKISFQLSDGMNHFEGRFETEQKITGHWTQPPIVESGSAYSSPVTLTKNRTNVWSGNVTPLDSMMTLFLMIKPREDGSVGAFLKNPEKNIGWTPQYRVDHIEVEGDAVKLFAANKESEKGRMLAEGIYHGEMQVLSIYFPIRGGTFDFKPVSREEFSNFYPLGRSSASYQYEAPAQFDDGWAVGTLDEAGISREQIEKMIQMIVNQPIDTINTLEIHGLLIARHGKLVFEKYFYGENREKAHDTRSAAKSFTSTLVGAALFAGVPLKLSSPIYQVMNQGQFPANLEARKKAITVEHLLTATTGLNCDDTDDNSPGREDYMVDESGETDYYRYTMDLPMIREPGEMAAYCSADPHLLGGVLQRAAGKSLPELFQDLLARPMKIEHYYMNLAPSGDAYMGGGLRLYLRDFLKFGQLYLDHGNWNHKKILSEEFAERAIAPQREVRNYKPRAPLPFLKYGYLWWATAFPFQGRTVQAFYAGGNGGQLVVGIPEFDLLIGTFGGNYNDGVMFQTQTRYIPEYILPAVSP